MISPLFDVGLHVGVDQKEELDSAEIAGHFELDGASRIALYEMNGQDLVTAPIEVPAGAEILSAQEPQQAVAAETHSGGQTHAAELPGNNCHNEAYSPSPNGIDHLIEISASEVNFSPASRYDQPNSLAGSPVSPIARCTEFSVLSTDDAPLSADDTASVWPGVDNTAQVSLPAFSLGPGSSIQASGHQISHSQCARNREALTSQCRSTVSHDIATTKLETYVKDLRDYHSIFHSEWKQRVSRIPELALVFDSLSAGSLFTKGIAALHTYFEGGLPRTFKDVLALMHFACASAYMLHHHDQSFDWDDFLIDMRRWTYTMLANDQDVRLYLKCMDSLSPSSMSLFAGALEDFSPVGTALRSELRNRPVITTCSLMMESKSQPSH